MAARRLQDIAGTHKRLELNYHWVVLQVVDRTDPYNVEGDLEVVIDMRRLLNNLGERALRSKGGKACVGPITVKACNRRRVV